MSTQEDKAYYRINEPDRKDSEAEITTGSKRSRKKLFIVIGCIVVVCIAVAVLLLILLLKSAEKIPSGYNGFVEKESVNMRYAYYARLARENNADTPIELSERNREFRDVDFHICMQSARTYRISYRPTQEAIGSDQSRWTVPDNLLERTDWDRTMRLSFGDFRVTPAPFGFTLRNPAHRNTFWLSTVDRNLLLSDRYMEVGFEIHSQEIFGWGERTRDFMLQEGEYTIWPTGIEKGPDPGKLGYNTFGDHPFILARLMDKSYIGLFFKNSNAKVMKYIKVSQGRSVINFKTIGGILDVFAFMGDTAEEVLSEYHKVVGKPHLPPLWALGFHQGSTSYENDTIAQAAVEKYAQHQIPLEALWLDESFMRDFRPFNVDPIRFKNIKTLAANLNKNHQWLGLSLHPCVPVFNEDGSIYEYFAEGKERDMFIKSASKTTKFGGKILIGEHLPGKCAYPDFEDFQVYSFWTRALTNLWEESNFNSLQHNYNEITHFCDGECPEETEEVSATPNFSFLPFNVLGEHSKYTLESQSLPLDAVIYAQDHNDTEASVHFNNRGIYGTQMMLMTYLYMEYDNMYKYNNQRSLVISRATYAGAGQYGGHWLGDNKATFEDMRRSISGILNFQMFGMPFTGANICGSHGVATQELCARWYQLGAFYPFARTDFDGEFGTKEAWALEGEYGKAAKNALTLRLSLLRYFYTIFFEIHQNGGSFWRPLFFEFPHDDETIKDIEHTFMIGSTLKITPVLKSVGKEDKISSYFPANTRFLDLITWNTTIDGGSKGKHEMLAPNWDFPLIHMREGRIMPFQTFNESKNTFELVKERFINLLVFPDSRGSADGTLYVDTDGLDQSTIEKKHYQYYRISYHDRQMRFVLTDGYDAGGQLDMNQMINNITIADAAHFNDTDFACAFNENMKPTKLGFTYEKERKLLHLYSASKDFILELRTLRGIQFGNTKTDPNFWDVTYKVSQIDIAKTGPLAGKQIIVSVEATSRGMISFNAVFTLLKDNLINVDIKPEIEPPAFEIPDIVLNKEIYPIRQSHAHENITSYIKLPELGENFFFEIHAKNSPSDVLFSIKNQRFIYTNYFKLMTSIVYGNYRLFGLGERVGDFWKGYGTYSIWNRAAPQVFENGEPPGKNLYGSHPVYFVQRNSGTEFFAVYDHNSGPQDFVIGPARAGLEISNIKTTGRTNLFFMMNQPLKEVVKNYYDLVGHPVLPPEWAFGWHQSRFGYNTTQALQDVYDGYRNASMPLDGLWSDVDVLDDFRDFTIEAEFFPKLKEFVLDIQKNGTQYIPIIGAGISAGDSEAYFDGMKKGVFLKSPPGNGPLIGRNTPGDVVFVDFFMHDALNYWEDQMNKWHDKVPFDGVWLDMNEIANNWDGTCYLDQRADDPIDNRLFYWPGGRDLEKGTISLDCVHATGVKELDAHSLFGLLQSYATARYFEDTNERPFIISRSTFAGSGKYAGHWTGDNTAEFEWMKASVNSIYLFNMFGIPFTGADICGFNGNATATMWAKWYKLGAIYPFARNHNNLDTNPQEPYYSQFNVTVDFSYNVTAHEIIRKAMLIRYGLHVYTYTQFHKASKYGIPPIRPMFFNYPDEDASYKDVEHNVMLGDDIKASTDLAYNSRITYYFPGSGGLWCPIWEDIHTQCFEGGSFQSINVPASEILLHMRAGSIVPIQLSNSAEFKNINDIHSLKDLANYRTDLALLLDGDNQAKGEIRFDGGTTPNMTLYDDIFFSAIAKVPFLFGPSTIDFTFNVTKSDNLGAATNSQKLGDIIIYNADKLKFLGRTTGTIIDRRGNKINVKATYNQKRNISIIKHDGSQDLYFKDIDTIHLANNP